MKFCFCFSLRAFLPQNVIERIDLYWPISRCARFAACVYTCQSPDAQKRQGVKCGGGLAVGVNREKVTEEGSGPSMLLAVGAGWWRRLHAKDRMASHARLGWPSGGEGRLFFLLDRRTRLLKHPSLYPHKINPRPK